MELAAPKRVDPEEVALVRLLVKLEAIDSMLEAAEEALEVGPMLDVLNGLSEDMLVSDAEGGIGKPLAQAA